MVRILMLFIQSQFLLDEAIADAFMQKTANNSSHSSVVLMRNTTSSHEQHQYRQEEAEFPTPTGRTITGLRRVLAYLTSFAIFEVGSALCGTAPDMDAPIVRRDIAGMGDRGERGTYITECGLHWGLGAVLGPVVRGGFTSPSLTWRFSFYINLIIAAVFIPGTLLALPSVDPAAGVSLVDRLKRFGLVGLVLGAGTRVAFTMTFTMAGEQWLWADGRTIATIVVFGVLFVLWAVQQTFCIFTTTVDRSVLVHLL
ncbi:conserved hypothetical protein [Talaromyces stipitatus ATCC 10500]|uniref:Uncharacterized protein n=1 Tax=Talaromyces stipitatus (strain ATCC 10500 / CBS 375.48 / QM 6759 / NRRL 1006) TaxID=441959 RepID=B8M4Q1_TALSN|nr:uncharacterized protein TSTA_025630 [Talaromyces stipitatus ATCC 10500]EED19246.1 conserved hypothetical protein [Talaromyces stipitatus ATCC 10500]